MGRALMTGSTAPERRASVRRPPPADLVLTLRFGVVVEAGNVSGRGALVRSPRPLRPGSRIHMQIAAPCRRATIEAVVLRCGIVGLRAAGVTYAAGLAFAAAVDIFDADQATDPPAARVPQRSNDAQREET
jgi:hypothetical protein